MAVSSAVFVGALLADKNILTCAAMVAVLITIAGRYCAGRREEQAKRKADLFYKIHKIEKRNGHDNN